MAATTPEFVDYNWYGRKVRVNLGRCHLAMIQKMVDVDLGGRPLRDVFPAKSKIGRETWRKFLRGEHVGPTLFNLLLKALDLRADQVVGEQQI